VADVGGKFSVKGKLVIKRTKRFEKGKRPEAKLKI